MRNPNTLALMLDSHRLVGILLLRLVRPVVGFVTVVVRLFLNRRVELIDAIPCLESYCFSCSTSSDSLFTSLFVY